MAIYKTAIKNPVTTLLVFVAVMIIGLFSFMQLPVDQFPEMDPPYVMVMTTYPGASASEIETNVSKIMENSLTSVDNLKHINSTSKDNVSLVILELEWGSDITEAVNDVRSFCDMAKNNLPDGCSSPMVFKFSTSTMPICQYSITADASYAALDKILNDEVIPQLNQVNGIGNLSVSGAPDRYVYVDIDQEKLDAYGISLETVGQVISANNLNLSSGTVKMNKEQYQMQVRSEFIESSEINNLMVAISSQGQQVFVRDIATVRDTIKDLSLDEKTNGRESVRLIVAKQSGSNTVQVCEDVQEKLAEIQKQLPTDVQIQEIYNSADNIRNSINSLEESVMYALLFVVLVVLFFLGKWRATLIISLTIPISLIVAFIYLKMADSSINIISLCSLSIAIGMVVDDAIVVLENITRHIERGEAPREASIYATNEVWVSVIATTLVLVAVFVPLTMMDGMAGIMFESLGWIVTVVCCTSTVIAITLTPMLCSKLLKARKVRVENGKLIDEEATQKTWYDRTVVAFLDKVDHAYSKSLGWCLKHKTITIITLFVFFGASLVPFIMGKVGTDFMAQQDNGRLSVTLELQRGTRIEETLKTARALEERFMTLVPEIQMISTSAGANDDDGTGALFSTTMNNTISMTVRLNKKWERERSVWQIAEVLRQEMATYPEIIEFQANVSSGGPGGSGGNTVDVEIYGYDFDVTNQMAQQIIALTKELPGARDVYSDRDDDRPEIKIIVDKEKASRHGLTSATISTYLRNRVNGMAVGFLKEDGDEYNIVVRLKEENRNSINDVLDFSIPTPMGQNIKLSEICSVDEYWAPPKIMRKARQRILTVKVTPFETSLGELAMDIQTKVLPQIDKPAGYTIRLAGSYEDQQESFTKLGMLGILILILVYIVMASQFESFTNPGIIMFTVPFALSGVILALWITGVSLDMIGALGIVLLVGIVVKNGIVLVDYINLLRERGHELNEAIQLSGKSRLRPVLMTAFTTILGMVPMAVSQGEGAEMWRPLGIVVIGGLTISTFLTLYIVPVLYGAISRKGERDKIKKVREQFIFMDIDVKDCEENQNS